ncbi:unnamed protein product [Anisakis simplex]|uniref:DAGKa domain-containing protein n=1 Tax=Anisakis simplex TaxID=6269 RepID=A0A0M3JIL5_ANISI|nr:unnamed protein product [Anisakis simplex]VDK39595.1 unnamed protein product [Anisakis simplex]
MTHKKQVIKLQCDEKKIDLRDGHNLEAIALLNIGSIYGGSNLWGTSRKPSSSSSSSSSSSWHLPPLFAHMSRNTTELQSHVQVALHNVPHISLSTP